MQNRSGCHSYGGIVEVDITVQREVTYLMDSTHHTERMIRTQLGEASDNNSRATYHAFTASISAESLTNFLCVRVVETTSGI
jgi:hypothetical protein